jgi:putative flippase GtrA
MSWLRQGRRFILVGLAQGLLDWSVMVALSHLGLAIAFANVAGRISGALLGYWLNGSITFARNGQRPGWRQFGRYVVLWCGSTVLSTAALSLIDVHFGLRGAWLAKPLVDGVLSIGSFLASRHWVYR